ncbi:uncharacterized protein LOC117302085 [Asterias rubens]|uniref:uncharacterized protein LOC117302085 n=1 Tax=Asterias rubens TaxID=7604 RepID=UPI001454E78E|nr:uncharacterized protein LOC117302085 [Asterias rubens]
MAPSCLWMAPLIVCLCSWQSTNLFVIAQTPLVELVVELANRTEGSKLEIGCIVNLQIKHHRSVAIKWVRETLNTTENMARNSKSLGPRYNLSETFEEELRIGEIFSIASLGKEDMGTYSCIAYNVNNNVSLASAAVFVSVSYFPATIDCFPDGPVTVQEGVTLGMSCTTEIGNPPSNFFIREAFSINAGWTLSQTAYRQTLSLERKIASTDDSRVYVCQTSQPYNRALERSCLIGPFTVIPPRSTTKSLKTKEAFTLVPMTSSSRRLDATEMYPDEPTTPLTESPSNALLQTPWIIISVTSLVLSTVSFAINIFIVVRLQRSTKEAAAPAAGLAASDPGGEKPYTELQQPRCNINRSYTELLRQSQKEENVNLEYEYPNLDMENSYDDVQVHLADHRCYQNI